MTAEAPGRRRRAKPGPVPESLLLHHGLVSTVLGFPLALLASGCLNVLLGIGQDPDPAQYQLVMWSVAPLWVAIVSVMFLAPSRRACWLWLLLANAIAALVFYGVAR
ncbi:hypothetical protein [Bordetella sp. BOR01]|uniref:hypothetical protein n=1 Tax=Bordetella sp. BOR01 TaxID=2854779 RepID=UPI001C44BA17|nr:hypothetical protein [Bordetella sp. BOR01]MBV7484055.1 hypothetical protein [Bordetella sp. BOR01]